MRANMDNHELLRLAKMGAQARLVELEREHASLLRAFPDLRARGRWDPRHGNDKFAADAGQTRSPNGTRALASANEKPRRERQLSVAARARIAAAQKRRWAEYRRNNRKGRAES